MTNLLPYNTFGISALASQFVEVNSVSQLHNLIQEKKLSEIPFLILGGGSNVLFTKDYAGLVLKNNLKGIKVTKKDENHIWVKAAGGEIWHDLVIQCVNKIILTQLNDAAQVQAYATFAKRPYQLITYKFAKWHRHQEVRRQLIHLIHLIHLINLI